MPRTHVIEVAVPVQVRVVDVIEVVDAHYIVMEEVGGPELTQLLQRAPGGRLPLHTTRLVFRDLLAGLRHAHGRGFVHCDLKPANAHPLCAARGRGEGVSSQLQV